MSNTSATGGYLTPNVSPAPLEDNELVDFFQEIVVGITGLPGSLVRPRWQQEPANIPGIDVSWAALGIQSRTADTFPVTGHSSAGQGTDYLYRQEELEILCSFYGPQADKYAAILRDGLFIEQNRNTLTANNMGVISVGQIISVPPFLNERWYTRRDMPVYIRRQITRSYPVLNLLSAEGTVVSDVPLETTFIVNNT